MRRNGKREVGLLLLAGLLGWAGIARGQELTGEFGSNRDVKSSTAWSVSAGRPGAQVVLAVILDIGEHYHINPDEAQLSTNTKARLIPTELTPEPAPGQVKLSPVQYPKAQDVVVNYSGSEQTLKAYTGRAVIYVPMTIAPDAKPGEIEIGLKLRLQACNEHACKAPANRTIKATLEIVGPDAAVTQGDAGIFKGFDLAAFSAGAAVPQVVTMHFFQWTFDVDVSTKIGLLLLVLMAGVGGFLLNVTPCVLPVIPIKIMGLSRSAGNRGRCAALGLAMSLGVVAFWMGMGVAITAVTGFTSINQLFQRPGFTIAVGLVIAAMAVGMCGLFSLRLPQWVYRIDPGHDTLAGSAGFGVMTAVLSTPCTAPFMGAAAAWAVKQPAATTLLVFAAIGLGMALPYLFLSAFPGLARRMPRTGPASELVKQVMGLFMLAAAAYFIGIGVSGLIVRPPDPPSRIYWWFVGLFVAAAGAWLAWRTFRITRAAAWRVVFGGLGAVAVVLAAGGAAEFSSPGPINWQYYTPERLNDALAGHKAVVLEFTAEWCLNCKTLEQTVLHNPRVVAALAEPGVVPIKVDLTGDNKPGNDKLNEVGAVAIPFLVVVAPDGKEVFHSDAYTVEQVLAAVRGAEK